MKFISDRMLGRLSRWLRIFGYDTLDIRKQENEDDVLLDLAEKEERILISRDDLLIRRRLKKGYEHILSNLRKSWSSSGKCDWNFNWILNQKWIDALYATR